MSGDRRGPPGSGGKADAGGPLPRSLFIPKEKSPRVLLGAVLGGIWRSRGGKSQIILSLFLQFFSGFGLVLAPSVSVKFPLCSHKSILLHGWLVNWWFHEQDGSRGPLILPPC